jgi:VanZ family protein
VLGLELLVLFVSSRPHLSLGTAGLPHLDKVAHFVEYAALGALLYRALRLSGGRRVEALLGTAALAALLALGDEIFQRRVPGRESSLLDWTADELGAIAGAWTVGRAERRWPGRFGLPPKAEEGGGRA